MEQTTPGSAAVRRTVRLVVAGGVAALTGALASLLWAAGPAAAHVTVDPASAVQGGFARVAFRVPNESDTASTVRLRVRLPDAHPLASVRTEPVPGWRVEVVKRTLEQPLDSHGTQIKEVVSELGWTAEEGRSIKPGEFQEFPVSLGRLPNADKLVFKAIQYYSDGKEAAWIDENPEAERPAPVLRLTPAASPSPSPAGSAKEDDSAAGTWLGTAGLVAGLGGLVLGGLAFARTRRPGAG